MSTLTLPSPAKLNLFLHITGRRPDGYHKLQTLFQLLDYGDELQLSSTDSSEIRLLNPVAGVATENNLIYRAAKLLQQASQVKKGAEIAITKRLPMGGGIGGGSSNAATTLVGLNTLWKTQLTPDQLSELGRQLGADVPVFVQGNTAWAEGIGEHLRAIEIPERWYLVLAPNCQVSTATIFSHKDLTRDTPAITVAAFLERGGKNVCQPLVERLFPQVRDAVEWLNKFSPAQLTGTGACVFASFSSKENAEAILAKRPEQYHGFVARGVNLSPLHQRLL